MNKSEYDAAVAKKRAEIEKQLDDQLKNNKELRELFDKYPERREMYIEKVLDSEPIAESKATKSTISRTDINPKMCRTCLFAHGEAPFEDTPEKRWCEIFRYNSGEKKPSDVYFDGAECEYYEKQED